jgi:hypothetical protein
MTARYVGLNGNLECGLSDVCHVLLDKPGERRERARQ